MIDVNLELVFRKTILYEKKMIKLDRISEEYFAAINGVLKKVDKILPK